MRRKHKPTNGGRSRDAAVYAHAGATERYGTMTVPVINRDRAHGFIRVDRNAGVPGTPIELRMARVRVRTRRSECRSVLQNL